MFMNLILFGLIAFGGCMYVPQQSQQPQQQPQQPSQQSYHLPHIPLTQQQQQPSILPYQFNVPQPESQPQVPHSQIQPQIPLGQNLWSELPLTQRYIQEQIQQQPQLPPYPSFLPQQPEYQQYFQPITTTPSPIVTKPEFHEIDYSQNSYNLNQQYAPTIMMQTTSTKIPINVLLRGEQCIDRVPHPFNQHQYISCLGHGDYIIMDCPDNLVFNKYLDRCDYNANEYSPCVASPCLNGGRCVDLPNYEYKCECLVGFSGKRCELAPDVCALNPCGPSGKCHSMPANSPIPFYCTCYDQHMYGLGCNRNSEINPCLNADIEESYFKTRIDPSLFIHCDGKTMHMKFCSRPLVFSTRDNTCEWEYHEDMTTTKTTATTTASPNLPVYNQPVVYSDVYSQPKYMYQEAKQFDYQPQIINY